MIHFLTIKKDMVYAISNYTFKYHKEFQYPLKCYFMQQNILFTEKILLGNFYQSKFKENWKIIFAMTNVTNYDEFLIKHLNTMETLLHMKLKLYL